MAADDAPAPRRGSRAKLWFMLIVIAAVAGFCWLNQDPVRVRPFPQPVPLYAVALGGLGVGLLFGLIIRSLFARRQKVKVSIT